MPYRSEPPRRRDDLLRLGFVGKMLDAVRVDVDQSGRQQPSAAVDDFRSVVGHAVMPADLGNFALPNSHTPTDHSNTRFQGTHIHDHRVMLGHLRGFPILLELTSHSSLE